MGSAPFLWKTPSTNMPFFPEHVRKNRLPVSVVQWTWRWLRLTKLERSMLMSTWPLLLLRPTSQPTLGQTPSTYSKSLPSRRARGSPFGSSNSDQHCGCQTRWAGWRWPECQQRPGVIVGHFRRRGIHFSDGKQVDFAFSKQKLYDHDGQQTIWRLFTIPQSLAIPANVNSQQQPASLRTQWQNVNIYETPRPDHTGYSKFNVVGRESGIHYKFSQ